jgi:O-succinylbenzoic acid--CoA ligase
MAAILSATRLSRFTGVSSLWPVTGSAEEIGALLRDWEDAEDPEPLIIETSGSTGEPKRVRLSRAAMRASADATHTRLGGPGRWELTLPPTYVAGVQVLYRSIRAGAAGRSYLSLVPTQLIRMRAEWASLTTYDAVLVGGGPLDPAVRADAEAAGVPVVQTYGMSETCGGCVYDGVPLDGVEVRIDDAGEVLLRGPVLFDGYDGDPARTDAAFRDGWLVTHDLGHWAEDGRLRIDGRVDDVIISGGVKVPALAVARALTGHPDVHDALVVGVADPEWGERVVAVVATEQQIALDDLRDLVAPRTWAPRQVVLVHQLPRLANGKPDRAAIRELARDA